MQRRCILITNSFKAEGQASIVCLSFIVMHFNLLSVTFRVRTGFLVRLLHFYFLFSRRHFIPLRDRRHFNWELGDFIRRSPRSAKIARSARCSDCDFRRSPRSAYKIADIWHVRYRRLNSLAFAKCARSRDFLRLLLRIASKA